MNDIMLASDRTTQIPLARGGGDDVDMPAVFGLLSDHKWPILIGTALFALVSVIYVLFTTPVYQATAVIQIEGPQATLPGQEQPAQPAATGAPHAATEVPLMTSRRVLGEAVKDLHLDIQAAPRRFPVLGKLVAGSYRGADGNRAATPWFGLSRYGWGGEQLKIAQFDLPDELLDVPLLLVAGSGQRYTLFDGAGRRLLEGRVGETARGEGVSMRLTQLVANPGTYFDVQKSSPLTAVNNLYAQLEAVERGKDSGIIGLSYNNTDPVVAEKVLEKITQAYVQQNVDRTSAEAKNRLQFVNEQLPKVRADLERAQAALQEFQSRNQAVDVGQQTGAILAQSTALANSIAQLKVQQADINSKFTSAHPAAQALMRQIGELEHEKAKLRGQLSAMPDVQRGLFRLTRDVEVTNQTYTNLMNEAQQLDIARASAIGNAFVIDAPAVDRLNPVWPKKVPLVLGATAAGALLMIGWVFVRQMFNRGVQDPAEIERLGLPVYASIMLSPKERADAPRLQSARASTRPRLLALRAPSDMAMEALRSLRTSLHFARMETRNNLLMIAGPSPGVGKSFVCSNLAVTIAQAGQRVLLIDADMRRGTLHRVLGVRAEDGLSELISGQIPLDDAIRRVAGTENLSFISRGRIPPNPSELLMHANFGSLLRQLESRYDLVIIDTPPVLAVTDAAVIGQHAGTSLLVVRYGENQSREIAMAKQRLEQNGVEVKGAIVNGVQKGSARSAGHYVYSYEEPLRAA
ncbi:polysaccharide biosynthesis tyrosine autokinase [Lysobacter yangpyeongensis]|uniref:Polysaccharide biosynthesis tyrosine autokinase n=1 Tax=Lysobacter yangpyeongensis TaxID=346182 RepID=A0ABW0SK81_9GAMM